MCLTMCECSTHGAQQVVLDLLEPELQTVMSYRQFGQLKSIKFSELLSHLPSSSQAWFFLSEH